jgi:hypothetical protein
MNFLSPLNIKSHLDDCLSLLKSGLLSELAGYKQLIGRDSIPSRNRSFLFAANIKLAVTTAKPPIKWALGVKRQKR